LRDETGVSFSFRVLRSLRDGADIFLVAEREGEGSLHILARQGDELVLVRDNATLARVGARLDILRRAAGGELVVRGEAEQPEELLGVFDTLQLGGEELLLAADLADPSSVSLLRREGETLQPVVDELTLQRVRQHIVALTRGVENARGEIELATVGLQQETIQLRDPSGAVTELRAAGRLLFEGRDLLFAAPAEDPERILAFAVADGEQLEPLDDEAFLLRLREYLQALGSAKDRA